MSVLPEKGFEREGAPFSVNLKLNEALSLMPNILQKQLKYQIPY